MSLHIDPLHVSPKLRHFGVEFLILISGSDLWLYGTTAGPLWWGCGPFDIIGAPTFDLHHPEG